MASVLCVANYILRKIGPTTTMKLQKLVYYCQAWSLAWDDKPLFDEDFEAWANGPVCPELFKHHKGKFTLEAEDEKFDSIVEQAQKIISKIEPDCVIVKK